MPALGIVGPFATHQLRHVSDLGAGSTHGSVTLQVPGSSRPPQNFRGEVSYAVVGGVFGYEYAFLRNFAARVVLAETLYSGTTGAAAAVVGTNARLSGDFGLTGGLTIGDSLRVSAVFDAASAPRIGLLLGPAVKAAYDSCAMGLTECSFDFGKLFESENVLTLTPGVAAAWAPFAPLGVTGNVSYVNSRIDTEGSESGYDALSFGAALDFDFLEISSVPVGLQATWNSLVSIAGSDAFAFTDLGGGVFYTGRRQPLARSAVRQPPLPRGARGRRELEHLRGLARAALLLELGGSAASCSRRVRPVAAGVVSCGIRAI